ncbi:pentapeptide repeat-containing protein [Prauserella muralis]|uniref:Uncharacterized protein n=1 Tax=Prauserella muralis TaxID=588067 RepID=A0A2V4B889_9PSEU|nr:pentapeptide repeat-containing protein [Prauserella muralis]PXY31574.1 hypothetical protein BAY60_04180 [Prauserella muralis]TWE14069.1 hypothetical protein FHX69_6204 [Prauserella muralis]
MWSWLGHGNPKAIAGVTAAVLLVLVVVGRLARHSRGAMAGFRPPGQQVRRSQAPSGRIAATITGWMLVAVLVAAGTGSGLLWLLGWPTLPPVAAFDTSQVLELLKIALAVVAGLGGVVLLAVNLRRQRVTEAEHGLARGRDEREREQVFNERFGTAAEQLAHESGAVRLAGVYAMSGLADDWVGNRQACVDVLTGYLRLPVSEDDVAEAKVRETLLRVLWGRFGPDGTWRHLSVDLSGARFTDADLSLLNIRGEARFDGAVFDGDWTVAGVAADAANFSGACFRAAQTVAEIAFSMVDVTFEGGELLFDSDRMRGQRFRFVGCTFTGVVIAVTGEENRQGEVVFEGCGFVDCTFDFTRLTSRRRDDSGGEPRFGVYESTLNECLIDLRTAHQGRHALWLVDSELRDVRFGVEQYGVDRPKLLNVRRPRLIGTELPERHTRVRGAPEEPDPSGAPRSERQ